MPVEDRLLHGTLHEPDGETAGDVCALFLAGPASNRSGPHRLHYRLAQTLEACGIPSLRFDYSGRGESPGADEAVTVPTMIRDAAAACDWLQGRLGPGLRLYLVANCLGCVAGLRLLEVAADVEGGVFLAAPRFSSQQDARNLLSESAHVVHTYARKLAAPATWIRAVREGIDYASVARALSSASTRRYRSRLQPRAHRFGVGPALPGKVTWFLWGDQDPGMAEREFYARFCASRSWRHEVRVLRDGDRSFSTGRQAGEVTERVCDWLGTAAGSGREQARRPSA